MISISKAGRKDVSVDTHDLICVVDASTQTEITYSGAHNEFEAEFTQPNILNNGYISDTSTIIIPEDEYNCDVAQFNTPTNRNSYDVTYKLNDATVTGGIPEDSEEYDSDATRLNTPTIPDDATVIPEDPDEYDSDATRLNTPTNPENVIHDVTALDLEQESNTSSDGSYIETYTSDPSYTGPAYQSLPCCKHGASYTPPGWKRIQIKRKKLEFPHSGD